MAVSFRLVRKPLTLAVLLALPLVAHAQYNPYNVYPTNYGRAGGTLAGGAQMAAATGQGIVDQEQARVIRQQSEQQRIKTKKMAFDEMRYERDNTPSWTDEQEKASATLLRRIMFDPNPSEINRGYTLNLLLPQINKMMEQGTSGPPVYISTAQLRDINVVPGRGAGIGMLGSLRNGGKLPWPLALRSPAQRQFDALLAKAIAGAIDGTLDAQLFRQVTTALAALKDNLDQSYRKELIDSGAYLSGKHFLESLGPSVGVLEQADAGRYFDGTYTLHGHNVPELVASMSTEGLRFGPASPGHDAAYLALHNAFVGYIRAAQSSGGFQTTLAPPSRPSRP